jgi:hypothetical protein
VGEAAYFSDWYNEPIKFQRSIIIIMVRTKHPVKISLKPLGTLSLEMFATVKTDLYSQSLGRVDLLGRIRRSWGSEIRTDL